MFQAIFGAIFTVIIALEFKRSLLVIAERDRSVVQVRTVVLIALLAIVRKLMIIDPSAMDAKAVATYVTKAKEDGIVAHLMGIIPDSYIGALARGDLLQVLLISILSGFAIALLGKAGEPISHAIDQAAKVFFNWTPARTNSMQHPSVTPRSGQKIHNPTG